ncbi:MAG: recombinase family protein [Clostridia bacterium]|nr:recombinase family protein [Clostridia bacterium]MDH7573227.1 recombinase family protein [Clostridia bacterium]
MRELIPAHLVGRRLEVLADPRRTLEQSGLPVGGYIRISTRKGGQLSSIENQKKVLSQWAELHRYRLVRFYIDVRSGEYVAGREELNRLREDIRLGRIRGVVTKEISRTSRDVMDVLELKREIAGWGGFFVSIKENYDSRTDDDEFLLVLHAALAQKERKATAGRVRITQLVKAREGRTNVPLPAFGYRLSADRQHLEVDPRNAPVYRFIVARFLEGWGQAKIARHLNAQGCRTRRGGRWSPNAVRTVLSNPVYLGLTIYNTTTLIRDALGRQRRVMRPPDEWIIREGTHPPLISPEEFEQVQAMLRERRRKQSRDWTTERKYLGSGLLRCAECGAKIYGARYPAKSGANKPAGRFLYRYRCADLYGRCSRPMKYWDMQRVDRAILELLRGLLADGERLRQTVREHLAVAEAVREDLGEELRRLAGELERLDGALRKQQLAYEQGAITLDEYGRRAAELREERHRLELAKRAVEGRLARSGGTEKDVEALCGRIRHQLDNLHRLSPSVQKELLGAAFEALYLRKDYTIGEVVFRRR